MRGMYLVLLEIYNHMSNVILSRLEFKCHLLKPEIRRSLFGGGLYLDVVFIWMQSLFGCGLYLDGVIFWMGCLLN